MTKLPILSSKKVIKVLRSAGFEDAPKRGKGSHSAMIKRSVAGIRLVIIPDRKSIPRGTLRAIIDQTGMSRDEFINLLKE
ncbi:MAG TPA: type II toxin-antitoxin system HicA family toxin [Desulfatiglandales bacterium]|nr:type II toxin-antitoxin system HicA family toxin [Desulfatiglandales bacterium]